ncbi:MAG: phage portal protein [Clostridia bacterium]|nr:phage portal protein [Clostridia bacterium]
MAIGKRKKESLPAETVAVPQTGINSHPFASLTSYMPQRDCDYALYKTLREAVPIIDAAIMKTVRLLGAFRVVCEEQAAQRELDAFLKNVNVGGTRQGIDAFISTFFEQLITYGTAVGEMVVSDGVLTHLYNSDLKGVSLSHGASPLEVVVASENGDGTVTPVPYPSLILLANHNPEPGRLYGTSVLKGLPFISDILLKIYNTIGINWERLGNVRFAVTYKPQNDVLDKAYAQERAQQVAKEWSRTMQGGSTVRDFVAVGDVSIKAIGADNQILDSEVPVRQLLEQIVAKLGIPPFLLGLSWSSTERMSYQQADILTSEIDFYRRELTPVIRKICDMFLRLGGYSCDFAVEWENITLQDISEIAKSSYYDAQTQQILSQLGGTVSE